MTVLGPCYEALSISFRSFSSAPIADLIEMTIFFPNVTRGPYCCASKHGENKLMKMLDFALPKIAI